MIELAVKISNDESRLNKKFIIYDDEILVSKDSSKLQEIVKSAIEDFQGNVDDVLVTIKMVW